MPNNRIAGRCFVGMAPGWTRGTVDEVESLYCPPANDPMSPSEEPVEHGYGKSLWVAVEELRRSEIERLERRIEVLERTALSLRGSIFPIISLIPGCVIVKRTIHAQVVFEDECYVASFVDANINASGETELDAIEMLKDAIASTFLAFSENECLLGHEPARQLDVLKEFVRSA